MSEQKSPVRAASGKFPTADHGIAHLLRAGRHDDAAELLRSRLEGAVADHSGWYRLAQVENHRRRFQAALAAIDRALAVVPQEADYLRLKGILLANRRAGPRAVAVLAPLVERNPSDIVALTALQVAHYWCGHRPQAVVLGTRVLKMEDAAVHASGRAQMALAAPAKVRSLRRKVIAFSLWGAAPAYNYGAIINARLAPFIYPRWECRFYLGQDVPRVTRRLLEASGARVVEGARLYRDVPPAMWRFLVADDPEVGVFVCRDCDARIGPKEAAAVDAWLASGRSFHVMRDHILHRNLMLAGLWGGRISRPLRVTERIRRFLGARPDLRYGTDQAFLAREVWPEIRGDSLVHDSYYTLFDARPFPALGRGDDRYHVGMAVMSDKALQREAALFGLPWPPDSTRHDEGASLERPG